METPASEQQYWIIEPLLDAGLELEQITALVFRLGFEAELRDGTLDSLARIVVDRPTEVQAAWYRTIERLLSAPGPTQERPASEPVGPPAARSADAIGRPGVPSPRPRRS